MCHFTNEATDGFGYTVDNRHIRHLIAEAQRVMRADLTDAATRPSRPSVSRSDVPGAPGRFRLKDDDLTK